MSGQQRKQSKELNDKKTRRNSKDGDPRRPKEPKAKKQTVAGTSRSRAMKRQRCKPAISKSDSKSDKSSASKDADRKLDKDNKQTNKGRVKSKPRRLAIGQEIDDLDEFEDHVVSNSLKSAASKDEQQVTIWKNSWIDDDDIDFNEIYRNAKR